LSRFSGLADPGGIKERGFYPGLGCQGKSLVLSASEANQSQYADNDEIDGDDIVQQARPDQDEDAGDQGNEGLNG
jgi:hypothetical protein